MQPAARQQAAAKASSMRNLVRAFFVAAGLIALIMVAYVVKQDVTDSTEASRRVNAFSKSGNLKGKENGPILPPREGHSHAGHSHGIETEAPASGDSGEKGTIGPGHSHEEDKLDGMGLLRTSVGSSSSSSSERDYIERAVSRVERKTIRRPGGIVETVETVFYSAPNEKEALALANKLVKDGTDVTIRDVVSGGGGSEGEIGLGEAEGGSTGTVEKVKPESPPPDAPGLSPWVALAIPGDIEGEGPKQRPIPGERDVSSHALEEAVQHSLNPPRSLIQVAADGMSELKPGGIVSPAEVQELEHRLVIGIANGVHSGRIGAGIVTGDSTGLAELPCVRVLLNTLLPVAQPHFVYRFYFGFDHNDPAYEKAENRRVITELYQAGFAAENAKRWHPEGSLPDSIDGSRLLHSVHWVHCDYSGKPSWAHSDAVTSAYKEGADYTYRTNDDAAFPPNQNWVDKFITNLRGRSPVPNLGVVGPTCHMGATWILTHDFTHKTHVAIFGWHYPRGLPDWSSDDWVTYIYQGFGLMSKLDDVTIEHTQQLGTRYNPSAQGTRLAVLNDELRKGSAMLNTWLAAKGVSLPYTVKVVDCC